MFNKFREVREQKHIRNVKKGLGKKLIHAAAHGDHDKVMKIIADCKGDLDVINYAPKFGLRDQVLFESNEPRHSTALEIAARNGHLGVVSALLKVRGIDVNARSGDFRMNTPLLSAVTFGHLKIAEALSESADINPNLTSETGETALTMAFLSCPDAVPAILRIPTLNINDVNRSKCSALHYAVRHRADGANYVEQLLAIPGIAIDLQDSEGYTPLMMAAKKGAVNSIKLLIDAGADIHKKNSSGLNAKEVAVLFRHPEVIELLDQHEQSTSQELSIRRNQP